MTRILLSTIKSVASMGRVGIVHPVMRRWSADSPQKMQRHCLYWRLCPCSKMFQQRLWFVASSTRERLSLFLNFYSAGGTPQWNSWSSWSNCSKSCSGGYRGRLRSCSAGKGCPGKSREIQICNKGVPCRKNMNLVWGAWSSCSATCGEGNKTRTRECTFSPAKCRRFRLTDSETCLNSEPCGAWANWEGWGKCTVSCGLGNGYS